MENETEDAVERWQGRLNTVLIEFLIFSALSNGPTYGGEIVNYSQKYLENVKIPTVYSIIRRALNDDLKLIAKVDQPIKEQKNAEIIRGTKRQYYDLTSEGKEYFEAIRDYLQKVTSENVISKLEEEL